MPTYVININNTPHSYGDTLDQFPIGFTTNWERDRGLLYALAGYTSPLLVGRGTPAHQPCEGVRAARRAKEEHART